MQAKAGILKQVLQKSGLVKPRTAASLAGWEGEAEEVAVRASQQGEHQQPGDSKAVRTRGCAPAGMRCEPLPSPGGPCEVTAGDRLVPARLRSGTRRIYWKAGAITSDKYASI